MGETTSTAVFGPFEEMWNRIISYLPSLAAGLLIILLGLVVCWLVKKVIVRILLLMRIDRPLRSVRWARGLAQADVRHTLASFVANIAVIIIFLVFLDNAVIVWKLDVLGQIISGLVFYLPKLIFGFTLLLIGSIVASAVGTRVRSGLASEGFLRASLAGRLTHWGVMIIVVVFTLEELGIAPRAVQGAFLIVLGTLGACVVLAVGLGSRNAIAKMWDALLEKPSRED